MVQARERNEVRFLKLHLSFAGVATMPYDPDNIFAKILRKELPAHIVEETDHTLTFMDVMPQSPGHALVIPKEPAANIFELSTEGLIHVTQQAQRVAKAALTAFQSEGVIVLQLNNEGAGQSVFHYHIHVIPRSGGLPTHLHGRKLADPNELEKNAQALQSELANLD